MAKIIILAGTKRDDEHHNAKKPSHQCQNGFCNSHAHTHTHRNFKVRSIREKWFGNFKIMDQMRACVCVCVCVCVCEYVCVYEAVLVLCPNHPHTIKLIDNRPCHQHPEGIFTQMITIAHRSAFGILLLQFILLLSKSKPNYWNNL